MSMDNVSPRLCTQTFVGKGLAWDASIRRIQTNARMTGGSTASLMVLKNVGGDIFRKPVAIRHQFCRKTP